MEFLKTVLGDELYAQVEAKVKGSNVKLADLSSGAYVSKSKYDDDIKAKDTKITELTDTVKKFDGVDVVKLQNAVKEWEAKYNKDLAAKDREYAKQLYFNGIKFASNLAKNAAMAEFDKKNLTFENGKFLGADDFIKGLRESDPSAFVNEEPGKLSTGMQSGGGTITGGGSEDDAVTKRFKELNPDIKL